MVAARLHTMLLLAAVAWCLLVPAVHCVPLSGWMQGSASFFGGPSNANSNAYRLTIDSGSCGYGDIDPRLYPQYNVVGLHASNPLAKQRPMSACGSCLEVQCTSGPAVCYTSAPIQMLVTDQCVESCNATNINIHVFGFEQLAALRFGRVHIRYRLVACEPADPITIHVQDYRPTEGGWIRLALRNVAGDAALTSVDIGHAGAVGDDSSGGAPGSWVACRNTFGAVWEAGFNGQRLPSPPLDLRITNSLKQQVIVKNFVAFAGMVGDVETTAQFPAPYEPADTTSAANGASDAPPRAAPATPSVTVGIAIPRPTNTIMAPTTAPPLPDQATSNASGAPAGNFTPQLNNNASLASSSNATPPAAGGGAAGAPQAGRPAGGALPAASAAVVNSPAFTSTAPAQAEPPAGAAPEGAAPPPAAQLAAGPAAAPASTAPRPFAPGAGAEQQQQPQPQAVHHYAPGGGSAFRTPQEAAPPGHGRGRRLRLWL